ncbi:hypothetical protein CALCODRAFT_481209 [Calocera cornea HHB12733]|uniref:Uncharacterized protein n=1 Tax=Calocera cornea HHB12733 TaxID=1353952 RepID=A0A165HYJ7_9BASI|nr:hypothetical protein CALCODRAFT_481209 [Calocera cornea HHB12733]
MPGFSLVVVVMDGCEGQVALVDGCNTLAQIMCGVLRATTDEETALLLVLIFWLVSLIYDEEDLPVVISATRVTKNAEGIDVEDAYLCGMSSPGNWDTSEIFKTAFQTVNRNTAASAMPSGHLNRLISLTDAILRALAANRPRRADMFNCGECAALQWLCRMLADSAFWPTLKDTTLRFISLQWNRSMIEIINHLRANISTIDPTDLPEIYRSSLRLRTADMREPFGLNIAMTPCPRCRSWVAIIRDWAEEVGVSFNMQHNKGLKMVPWRRDTEASLRDKYLPV